MSKTLFNNLPSEKKSSFIKKNLFQKVFFKKGFQTEKVQKNIDRCLDRMQSFYFFRYFSTRVKHL